MRKIILGVALSLDGKIEGPAGEYDWCLTDQDYGMSEFLSSVDTLFMGRKTFEVAGSNPFPKMQCYVFSNRLADPPPGIQVVRGDFVSMARTLKQKEGKDIWLFGGAALFDLFLQHRLVDELWLSVHPLILGSGKWLFPAENDRIPLELIGHQAYNTGLISLKYKIL